MSPAVPALARDWPVEAADFMRLFSTPSRLTLLSHIAERERSVSEIQQDLDFKQPALSQQLAELRQAGVVQARRESRQIYYSIADQRVLSVVNLLSEIFRGVELSRPKSRVEAEAPKVRGESRADTAPFLTEMAKWARIES